jgi:uroporphyrinogen decarboxylase
VNSLERVFTAINLGIPDRVPIFECTIAPRIVEAVLPGGSLEDLVEKYDLDVVYYREAYHYEPVNIPKNYFRDEWGIVMLMGEDAMPSPAEHPIQKEEDLRKFSPPDPHAPHRLARITSAVRRFKGVKPVALGMSDAFAIPWKLRGMSDFLMDLKGDPSFAKKIIDMVVEYNCELVRAAAKVGVDIIRPTDDYAFNTGPMMSPQMWKEFFQPGLKKIVDTAHEYGLKVVKHTDGLIRDLIDPLLETGIDALHPIEPLPGQSLAQFKERYGKRICLIGNINCKEVLTSEVPEIIIEDVRRSLTEGAAGGGYMIASSNSIHSAVPPKSFQIYVEAAHALGKYPLSL